MAAAQTVLLELAALNRLGVAVESGDPAQLALALAEAQALAASARLSFTKDPAGADKVCQAPSVETFISPFGTGGYFCCYSAVSRCKA